MKKRLSIILLAGLPFALIAGENLIKNGDFEQGSSEWGGDANIVFETKNKTNRVCKIDVGSEEIKFSQRINTENIGRLKVRFRLKKSSDYKNVSTGRTKDWGYMISFYGDGESGKHTGGRMGRLPTNNDWGTRLHDSFDVNRESHLTMVITVMEGVSGSLSFDDIEVIAETREDERPAVCADEYRTFTDRNGREIEAKIIRMASNGQKVCVKRKGQQGYTTVPVTGFNDETQAYIKCWSQHSDFLDDSIFSVAIKQQSQELADKSYEREWSDSVQSYSVSVKDFYHGHWLDLAFKNKSDQMFGDVLIQYCVNYYQEHGTQPISVSYGRLYNKQTTHFMPESEKAIRTEQIVLRNYDNGGLKYGGVLEGIILYLTLPLETGDTMTREIIWPKNLEYRWTDQTYNVQRPIPVD